MNSPERRAHVLDARRSADPTAVQGAGARALRRGPVRHSQAVVMRRSLNLAVAMPSPLWDCCSLERTGPDVILKTHYGEIGPLDTAALFRIVVDGRVYLLAAYIAVVLAGCTEFQCEGACLDQTLMMVYRMVIGLSLFLTIGLMLYNRLRRLHLTWLCFILALLSIAVVELILWPLGMTQGWNADLFVYGVVVPLLAIEAALAIWWFRVRPSYDRYVTSAEESPGATDAGPELELGTTRVSLGDLDQIRADSRGVLLSVRGQEIHENIGFNKVMSVLQPGFGAQISRSLWVADRMFDNCDRSGKVLVVVLRDGARHSIGSSRRAEVLDWASRLSLTAADRDDG